MHNFFFPRSASSIVSTQACIFSLNMPGITIYVAQWLGRYLSKRSLIKHTSSWCDKVIIYWKLSRQVKKILRILPNIFLKSAKGIINFKTFHLELSNILQSCDNMWVVVNPLALNSSWFPLKCRSIFRWMRLGIILMKTFEKY